MRKAALWLVVAWMFLLLVSCSSRGQEPPACFVPCRILGEPHDADTFHADVLLPWGVTLRDRVVRTDFDAWEVNRTRQSVKVGPEEIRKGKAALAAFNELRRQAEAVYLQPTERESGLYDRISASVWLKLPGQAELLDVHRWMRERGHLRPAR